MHQTLPHGAVILPPIFGKIWPRKFRAIAALPRYACRSKDPQFAAEIANAYLDSFIAANLQNKFDSSAYASTYLQDQLVLAKARLEESERKQVRYARRYRLVDVPGQSRKDGFSLTQTDLAETRSAPNAARLTMLQAEASFRVAQITDTAAVPELQDSAYFQELQVKRAQISASYARDTQRYRQQHPVMQQYQQELAEIDDDLADAGRDIRRILQKKYQSAANVERKLTAQLEAVQSGFATEQKSPD